MRKCSLGAVDDWKLDDAVRNLWNKWITHSETCDMCSSARPIRQQPITVKLCQTGFKILTQYVHIIGSNA